jgi:pimeloyl-ACP methyl ester carboxylesterase
MERFLAFRRSLPHTPRLHRQMVRVRDGRAIYRAWFANRELAELFAPPRSDSLTGAAIAARSRRDSHDWRPVLSALSAPALVFHGTEDPLPTGMAEGLARLIHGRLTLIPYSGHIPFWEAPETFFPAVESFLLARTSSPAAQQQ